MDYGQLLSQRKHWKYPMKVPTKKKYIYIYISIKISCFFHSFATTSPNDTKMRYSNKQPLNFVHLMKFANNVLYNKKLNKCFFLNYIKFVTTCFQKHAIKLSTETFQRN